MERAQEFLAQLEYDLEKAQLRLGLSIKRRRIARMKLLQRSTQLYQSDVERVLRAIITLKAKIEAVKAYIVAVQGAPRSEWADERWYALGSAEDMLAVLGIKDNCVRYTNLWY